MNILNVRLTSFFAVLRVLFLLLAFAVVASAQTLLDNYDGAGDLAYTTEGTWVIASGQYEGQTGGVSTPEHSYASYDLSNSISGWELNRAKGNVWFGWMDLNRTSASGWGASNYSSGLVLAANDADFNASTTSGVAVGFNSSGAFVVFKFSAGIVSGVAALPGTSSTIVSSGYTYADTDNGVNFFVEYLSDGTWTIYFKGGAKLSDADAIDKSKYVGGNATSALPDNTNTGTAFKYAGWIYAHSNGAADKAFFDNFGAGQAVTTSVTLQAFRATSLQSGNLLTWQTGFEVDNLGFKVYRERNGKRVPINRSIIAGSALMTVQGTAMTAGNSYSWFDPAGASDSVYYLEDIDVNGTRTLHGPVVPSAGAASSVPGAGRAFLLNDLNADARANRNAHSQRGSALSTGSKSANSNNASQLSASAASSSQSQDKQKALAAMPGLKLSVRENGWYRATQAQLVAAGLNAYADMRYLQLYADGVEIPIFISSSKTTGALKPGDSIEFYGVGLDTPSADTREYWLILGTTLGKRIKAQPLKSANSGGLLGSFEYTVESKERLLYFSGLLNGEKENFFGQVINSEPVAHTLSVQHLNPGAASRLELALQGVTLQDHIVRVWVNGTDVGLLSFTGQQNKVAQLSIQAGILSEGDNAVTLLSANGEMDISLVDYVRLNYAHTYQADNDYLQFTINGRAQVSGFSLAAVVLLDITDLNAVSLFNPKTEKAADGYRFTVQTSATRTFLALTDLRANQVAALTRNQPSDWSTNSQGADFVVITHRDFRNSVEPLAQLRLSEGMSVAVVDIEDVYDEFSYGAHDGRAIRDFLAWTQTHWTPAPQFVLLVGDGSFDPRNYLVNTEQTDLVPARLIDTALMETVSDDWFVDFDNDGVGELALGRLPVSTVAEADTMISKIVNYSPGNAMQSALMVADTMDANTNFNFEAASDTLGCLLPASIGVQKVYRGNYAPSDVHDQIVNGVNQGPLLVNFIGHGSVEVWTGDQILSTSDAATFNNGTRLPVFLMMTCLNGYYQNPARESLAESLVRTDAGGAIAVWASSGMTEPVPQFDMSRALYQALFGDQPSTLGEAIRRAKIGNSDTDVRRTWILFGDPTMRVR